MSTSAFEDTRSGRHGVLGCAELVAHRGASGKAPENTLSAVRAAVACGVDAIEIDVRRSRDGEFVVIHDATVGRTTELRWSRWRRHAGPRVDDLTAAELSRLDVGAWKGPSFVGERIPTLAEVLELVAASPVRLLIEIKRPVGSDPRHVTELASLLEAGPLHHRRITVQSFDARVLKDLRDKLPAVALAVLARNVPNDLSACSWWADEVNLRHRAVDRRSVDAVHGWGMRCVAWTVNTPSSARRVLDLGVDGVITDHPQELHDLVRSASKACDEGRHRRPHPSEECADGVDRVEALGEGHRRAALVPAEKWPERAVPSGLDQGDYDPEPPSGGPTREGSHDSSTL